ncbi:MAG: cytochrome C, partial [Thermodesulfobacteriota bacterium]
QSSNICDDCHSTNAWIPASFNHNNITSPCYNCHNGTQATGKNPGHIQSSNICDDCHSTNAWIPASFDHTGVTGSCSTCHNGTQATGKPGGHFVTSEECNACHDTRGWIPTTKYNHTTANYPGDHKSSVGCLDCHTSNTQSIAWKYGGYKPDCAACHAGDYKRKSHKKTSNPSNIYYTESELRDCSGACHKYTDNTFTTISKTRNHKHDANDGGF